MTRLLTQAGVDEILDRLPSMRVGLIGDLFLDRYFELDPRLTEQSIETGLDAFQVDRIRNQPGALGTVMANLAALGVGELLPISVIGNDGLGTDLADALALLPVDLSALLRVADRLTPTYLKPLVMEASGPPRELNRLDIRTRAPLSSEIQRALARLIEDRFTGVDGWIVLDQVAAANEGVVHESLREIANARSRAAPRIPLIVDSRTQLASFKFGCLKGNESEFMRAAACQDARDAVTAMSVRTGRPAFMTQGARGIVVAEPDGRITSTPAVVIDGPIDIVGAGDAATAGLLCAYMAGASPVASAEFANIVASITVQQCGTTGTASPADVRRRFAEKEPSP